MGYQSIDNLYKYPQLFLFKEVFASEKIHGTSAHISFNDGKLGFFAGGENYNNFIKLFNHEDLAAKMKALQDSIPEKPTITVFGEAYGGKCQAMSDTYGKELKFIAFEVQIGDIWLNVPKAHKLATDFGLEFVFFTQIPCTIEAIDAEMRRSSTQAVRNGCGDNKMSEGVVLRPLEEVRFNNGERCVAKHKNPEFSERRSKKDTVLSPEKTEALTDAKEIAEEWVTEMRAAHVADKLKGELQRDLNLSDTPRFINNMVGDVLRESKGEVLETKENLKAIKGMASKLFVKMV